MDDLFLFVSSILNLFISGVFMGLAQVVFRRAEADGTVLWVDLGRTMVLIGACLVAQSLVIASVAVVTYSAFKFMWFIVFILFAITGFLVANYCRKTSKMLESLLGGGE